MMKKSNYYEEYFVYATNASLSAGDGTVFEEFNVRIDSDSNFKFLSTLFVATSPQIYIKMQDDSIGRYLTKKGTDIQAIGGRSLTGTTENLFLPFRWPKPYIIRAGTNLALQISDYSGSANTLRLAYHGSKIQPGVAPWDYKFRATMPMVYSVKKTLAANSSDTAVIDIDIDSHFLIKDIVGVRTGGALVTISEGARNRDWSNTSIHIDNIMGNGQFPNKLPSPRFIQKGSTIIFNLQDLSGFANTVEIDLVGVKLYE